MKYSVNFDITLKKNPYTGLYIALEGIDGSGKTTQVKMLKGYFESQGKEVVITHEPRRDGVMGELVKNILTKKIALPKVAIQYLFAAQRATFLDEIIEPALKKGLIVISDRCLWSALPYGLLDKYESEKEQNTSQLMAALSILSMYHEFLVPDISFVLDVSVDTAGARLVAKGEKAELYEQQEKLEKLKEGYEFLLEKFPETLVRIDGEKSTDAVEKEILEALKNLSK